MKIRFALFSLSLMFLSIHAAPSLAQDNGYRFQPPRPPPLDGADFDEGEDEVEMDDDFRPPPPPPPMGGVGGTPPPPSNFPPPAGGGGGGDFRPGGGFGSTTPDQFRFKIVEGEYWEKGKKRTRGQGTRVTGSSTRGQ